MPDASPFLRLPEELLTVIVDACAASERGSGLNHLQNLRLIHPRLAHLKRLKDKLFRVIHLRPDPRRLRAQDEIKSIAAHVSHIVFEPVCIRTSSCQALNFSVMKARRHHEQEVYKLVRDGAVEAIAPVLRLMIHMHSVTVRQPKLASDHDVLIPRGDFLLSLAVRSMVLAGVECVGFSIEHEPHPDFDWSRRIFSWRELTLSKIKRLDFRPTADTREEIAWQYHPDPFGSIPPPLVSGLEPDATLAQLLRRCSTSLEDLHCSCPALVLGQSWNGNASPSLQALRKLEVSDCRIYAESVGSMLSACKQVETVEFTRLRPSTGEQLSSWRPVFDAVRNHDNKMLVTLNDIDVWAGLRWRLTLQHHTSQHGSPTVSCFPPKLCSYLAAYMARLREWMTEDEQEADMHPA